MSEATIGSELLIEAPFVEEAETVVELEIAALDGKIILAKSVDDVQETTINPEVSTLQFKDNPEARFWIGRTAVDGVIVNPEYFDGLTEFRANVYVHKLKFLEEDVLDEEGRETDEDDYRSLNVAVVEQYEDDGEKKARIVGSGRLIGKDAADKPLPIEHYFPEVFADGAIPVGDVEVSRFISSHPDKNVQHKIALAVIRAMTLNASDRDADTYCIIEKPLVGLLKFIGLPLEILAPAKDIPEYGGVLFPVKIDPRKVIESVATRKSRSVHLKEFFSTAVNPLGEGFYPDTLVATAE